MTTEFIEIIARKKCVVCKQYMPKEILTPKCQKCYTALWLRNSLK